MAIHIGSDKMKEIYIGGDRIKEVYIGSDLVYSLRSAAFNIITESVSSFVLSVAKTLRQQSYTPSANNNGCTFKSAADNSGMKIVYYDVDVRQYSSVTASGQHYTSYGGSGNRCRVEVLAGTLAQLNSIGYDNTGASKGCVEIIADTTGGGTTTDIAASGVDISSLQSSADPVYIALRLNSYYGATNRILLDTLTLS